MPTSGAPLLTVPQPPLGIRWGARSDRGGRDNNEDSFLVSRVHRSFDALRTNLDHATLPPRVDQDGWFLVVADGLGGAAGGEVASALAISAGVRFVLGEVRWNFRLDEKEIAALLERAHKVFRSIDSEIADHAAGSSGLAGMGTTLTAAYAIGRILVVLHVGDSRAYLLREGALRQLTRDQTLAQRLADDGAISQEEVGRHQLRHVLNQAMGRAGRHLDIDAQQHRLEVGDRLLLTTDGLIEEVGDEEIAEALAADRPDQEICDELVERAVGRGAHDNVTVVIATFTDAAAD